MHRAKIGTIRGVTALSVAIVLLAMLWLVARGRDTPRETAPQTEASVEASPTAIRIAPPASAPVAGPAVAHLEGVVRAENGSSMPSNEGIDGRVVDANGGPVAGALVTARDVNGGADTLAAVVSDSSGRFHLEASAGLLELAARADGYSAMIRHVAAPARAATLVLSPGASLEGRVLADAAGTPIEGALVVAINEDGLLLRGLEAGTSADGAFRIDGLVSGSYTLRVTAAGFQDRQQGFRIVGPGEQSVGTLRMAAAATLRATVFAGGRPCSGATLLLNGPTGIAATSDADGTVTVTSAKPGRYELKVSCPDALPFDGDVELASDAPTVRRFELEVGLTLRGTVRRANGTPLQHAEIVAMPVEGSEAPSAGATALGSTECLADDDARFVCRGLTEGTYDVSVRTSGLQRGPTVRVVTSPGREPSVDLIAPASGTLKIVLNGTPSASAIVVASGGPDRATRQATRTGGAFVFDGLALGHYRVRLASSETAVAEAELSHDGELVTLTLAAPQDRAITGHVLDEQGQPVVDAWVVARSNDEQNHGREGSGDPALTDSDGAFVIPGLFDGHYGLVATSASGQATLDSVRGGTENVRLVVSAREERGP